MTAAELSDAREDYYIPISAEAGKLLYSLTRAIRPETVVEFGTSYGISTLYLAAAVTDDGTGHVFTTELSKKKAAGACANLDEAGVGDAVTILSGDALETLADVPGPIQLALLDGWKDLCLPVLCLLEPQLAPGALVAADDSTHATLAKLLAQEPYLAAPAADRPQGLRKIAHVVCGRSPMDLSADRPFDGVGCGNFPLWRSEETYSRGMPSE